MNTERRAELIENYIENVLDNMSTRDLMRIVGDQIEENLLNYSDSELLTEIGEHYPELLNDNNTQESSFQAHKVVSVKVNSIEFDFDDESDEELSDDVKETIINRVKDATYTLIIDIKDCTEAEFDDAVSEELTNVISNETGWCINSIDYEILN